MLADAVLVAIGTERTVDHLTRVEWVLRSATRTALRRYRRRDVTGDHADQLARDAKASDGDAMRRSPIMVREIWYDVPPGLGGAPNALDDEYDLDDLDERLRDLRERDEREARDGRDDEHERDAHERDAHTREDR